MIALAMLNGVFSGAEIATLSVRRTRIEELVEKGGTRARSLAALRADPERFLATVQIGITLITVAGGAYSGAAITERVTPLLEPFLGPQAEGVSIALVLVVITALNIVIGELVPKSLALRHAETYALLVAPLLRLISGAARPVVWALTASSNVLLRLFGDRTSFTESRLSRDEIVQLVEEAGKAGSVHPDVSDIAVRALDFGDVDVGSVMVPRPRIVSIPVDTPLSAFAEIATRAGHARLLVHGKDLDDVLGYVHVREVLARASRDPRLKLTDVLREVPFAPETLPAPVLLRDLQRKRAHLAVVLDELGQVRGLVTVEDLVEELVGEIRGENDRSLPPFHVEPDGSAVVEGSLPVHEANRELDLELPEGESYATVAGLVLEVAGRIPARGERFVVDGHELEVLESTERRVQRVRLRRLAPSPAED